jgi:hypothetical protein
MGQKLPLCGQLGAARSRQDESKEVGEAGSKRTSSGGNGGHHVWWSGLIFRLLFSGPSLGGDEVNIQRAPSHPAIISTAITAVHFLGAGGPLFIK